MKLDEAIKVLAAECQDPRQGLPEPVFLLLSGLTPMVNVDLLIKDDQGRVLLTWRDDIYHGRGWHIPGGIIRFQELARERIVKVAELELGCEIDFEAQPIVTYEHITKTMRERGHAISFLYRCKLVTGPLSQLKYHGGEPRPGMYDFFSRAPENLLKVHEMYREYINNK
ncbi:MAG: NUDIX hydrolase [Candidatus Saganbacteria bacterium]|nr:NUDIX hydrolase [Candidatus Saganbacteria bacterium]